MGDPNRESELMKESRRRRARAMAPAPGELGPGPDELVDSGDINEPVPRGQALELACLVRELKRRREELGQSLTDVSERSGLTRSMVSQLENGWNLNPTLETLYRLALALDMHIKLSAEALPSAAPTGGVKAPADTQAPKPKRLNLSRYNPPGSGP